MFNVTRARVSVRAAVRAAACCSAAGLGLTAAYVFTNAVDSHASAARVGSLADAAAEGFSESALRSRGDAMPPGALAIARRHDRIADADTVFGGAERDAQAARFGAQLDARARRASGLRPAAARPFGAGGALADARETECLTQAVYYEARGETPAGQAAVAQVVLNRVRHPAFPKSVCGVVFQGAQFGRGCQFSFACDGSLRRTRETGAWRRSQKVAARALAGFVMADVGNATHFHAARIGPQWDSMVRVSQVGLHVFYRLGGRGGAPGAFQRPYEPQSRPQVVYASLLPVVQAPAFLRPSEEAQADPAPGSVEPAARPADPPMTVASAAHPKPKPADLAAEPTAASSAPKATQAVVSAS